MRVRNGELGNWDIIIIITYDVLMITKDHDVIWGDAAYKGDFYIMMWYSLVVLNQEVLLTLIVEVWFVILLVIKYREFVTQVLHTYKEDPSAQAY